jgi:hypothetical protein
MNLGQIRAELQARGYDYLSTARCTTIINMAVDEINGFMPWPFLQATLTSTAPVTIADLHSILSVTDTTNDTPLYETDQRYLPFVDPDVDDTGYPSLFWLADQTLKIWPAAAAATLVINYIKDPTDLSADGDTPLIPSSYHDLIVHGAHGHALMDNDDWQGYQVVRGIWQDRMNQMVLSLMGRNLSGPELMVVTDPRDF